MALLEMLGLKTVLSPLTPSKKACEGWNHCSHLVTMRGESFVKAAEVTANLGAYSDYVSLNIKPGPGAKSILPSDIFSYMTKQQQNIYNNW